MKYLILTIICLHLISLNALSAASGADVTGVHKGTVTQSMNSEGYTYIKIQESGSNYWIAAPETKISVGDIIIFPDSPPLLNFKSKSLKKTFSKIMFVPGIKHDTGASPPDSSSTEPSIATHSDVDAAPTVQNKKSNKNYAIVIGIENYRQKLPKADHATNDATVVTNYLVKSLGYPEENVITLTNEHATKSDLDKYLSSWLKNNVEKDSSVFIYYSGHGAPNPKNGDAYLVPYDGDPAYISDTGYSLKQLYANLAKLPAKQLVVALDSCFSGAGGKSVAAPGSRSLVRVEKTTAQNIVVMTASADDQISSTYMDKGHGIFTYFLLKGIKEFLEGDSNNRVRIADLYAYLKPKVESISRKKFNSEQTPQLITADERMKKVGLR
jgi:hypothetical protein